MDRDYPTASGNATTATQPTSEVQGQMNLLDMNIGDLENAFQALAQRLDPLLPHDVPPSPTGKLAGEMVQTRSPIGMTLQSHNARLNSLLSALHNLRNDLHI